MKSLFAAVILTAAFSATANASSIVCVVADPTGTPLNIRLQPNGQVVNTVRNGTRVQVFVEDSVSNNGQLWHSIALPTSAGPDGFVLARYLRCP